MPGHLSRVLQWVCSTSSRLAINLPNSPCPPATSSPCPPASSSTKTCSTVESVCPPPSVATTSSLYSEPGARQHLALLTRPLSGSMLNSACSSPRL